MGYAIRLYFDAEMETAVVALRAALARVAPALEHPGDRPHVGLALLDELDAVRCTSMLERFASVQPPLTVELAAFGMSAAAPGVVYLGPTPSERLLAVHRKVCRELSDTGARVHELCVPGRWMPYSPVGVGLPREEASVALSWLHANFKPVSGAFSSIGLVELSPVREIATFDLPEGVADVLASLGIQPESIAARRLVMCREADELVVVTTTADGVEHLLTPAAAAAWRSLFAAARSDGVVMKIVSTFRSVERQASIIRGKLARGMALEEILRINAPPGYSEHHTGRAVDVGTTGVAPLDVEFERTEAFRWLSGNAARFGFALSYPRNNAFGFDYEPWHWCFREGRANG